MQWLLWDLRFDLTLFLFLGLVVYIFSFVDFGLRCALFKLVSLGWVVCTSYFDVTCFWFVFWVFGVCLKLFGCFWFVLRFGFDFSGWGLVCFCFGGFAFCRCFEDFACWCLVWVDMFCFGFCLRDCGYWFCLGCWLVYLDLLFMLF